MKKIYVTISLVLMVLAAGAQKLPVINQFQYTKLFYNPAFAGSNERLNAVVLTRFQWTNFGNNDLRSPFTALFSIDAPLKNRRIGLGATLANDRAGVTNQFDLAFNGSYSIKVSYQSFLNMGLKLGFTQYNSNLSELNIWQQGDPAFTDISSALLPRVGFGVYFHHVNYYAGFSAPDLVTYDPSQVFSYSEGGATIKTLKRNYILMGGTYLNLTNRIVLIPSAMVKYFPNTPLSLNLSAATKLNETIMAGITYRTPTTFGAFGQFLITEKIRLGAAYEFTASKTSRLSDLGSFEFMLSYGLQQ